MDAKKAIKTSTKQKKSELSTYQQATVNISVIHESPLLASESRGDIFFGLTLSQDKPN